ncbi:MAG: hypothetical protein FWF32_07865, partial [Endomicrobia bacterium]|nr:hypothetical protein [Endomicrobiia bacterium]
MKRKILISFLAVIFSVSQCFADGGGTTVFNFLKMPLNAQVASMAGISSIFVSAAALNPSLIAFSEKPVLSAAYAFHFQNVNYNSLSFSYPFKKFGMNITYGGMNYGHIDSFIESNGDYEYNGSVNADDAFVSVGIGKEITENILLGASAKYVWQKIDDSSIDGIAFSFSGTYLFSDYTFYFSGGVENIGPKVDEYDLPSSVFVDFVDSLSDFIPFSYAVGLRAYF